MQTELAVNTKISAVLADAERDVTTELVIRKKGLTRGRGTEKKVYGNDLVHVVLRTGFNYHDVVARSKALLDLVNPDQIVVAAANLGLISKENKPVNTEDVKEALESLRKSFVSTLEGTNKASTEGVFNTLEVDGEKIPGGKVYQGPKDGQKHATDTPPGTIYLQGLKIAEKVLQEAENGPIPSSQSSGMVLAKRLIQKDLPVGQYVNYILRPDEPFVLYLGGTAPISSDGTKVRLRTAKIKDLFGVDI